MMQQWVPGCVSTHFCCGCPCLPCTALLVGQRRMKCGASVGCLQQPGSQPFWGTAWDRAWWSSLILLAALPSTVQVPHSADLCPEIFCVLRWFCPCQVPCRREVSAKHLGLEFPCEVHPERSYPSDLMADLQPFGLNVSLHVVVQIQTH